MSFINSARSLMIAGLLAFSVAAQAQPVPYVRAGATCAGAATGSFSAGSSTQLSLCIDTLASGTGICGASIQPMASPGQSGVFNITNRVLGPLLVGTPTIPEPPGPGYPITIIEPTPDPADFGGFITGANVPAAANGQLLATFTITPVGTPASNQYTIIVTGALVAGNAGSSCASTAEQAIAPSIVLNLSAAPAFTASTPPAGTVNATYAGGTGYQFAASGTAPITFTAVSVTKPLPAGFTLSSAGLLAGSPTVGGTFTVAVTAANSVGSVTQDVTLVVNPAGQTVTLPAQTSPRLFTLGTFPIAPATGTVAGTGGLAGTPITYSSTTSGVCTVNSATQTVSILTVGTCTIAANRVGNASYLAAGPSTQNVTISADVPSQPGNVVGSATGVSGQGRVIFNAPTNTGGTAITGYGVTCRDVPTGTVTGTDANAGTTLLSHVINGLTDGTAYTCIVRATNAVGFTDSAASNQFTPSIISAPIFTSPTTLSGTVGVAISTFNIAASGGPAPTISVVGTVPGITFNSPGATGTATLTGTPTQAGTFVLTFRATNASGNPTQTFTLTVAKGTQTVNFTAPSNQPYSVTPITLTATTVPVGRSVTFASTTGTICSITGSSLSLLAAGVCTLTATQAGDANYNAVTTTPQSFTISAGTNVITFNTLPSRAFALTPQAFSPATASSGLPISYSAAGNCTVSGSTFTTTALGNCTITASQAGDTRFAPATSVPQSFTITIGTQIISFSGLQDQPLGTAPIVVSATATSGLPVTVSSSTPSVCTTSGTNGTTVTMLILGTCTLQGTQAGNGTTFGAATPVSASFNVIVPGAVNLRTSSNPSRYRSPLLLTADIQGTSPTGSVNFVMITNSGPVTLCSAVPLVSARATCPVSAHLNVANPTTYTATYSGDINNPTNTKLLQQLVDTSSVTLSVATLPIQPAVGATVELRATVAAINLSNKVTFNENGTALPNCGAVTVTPLPGATDIGVASCTITGITTGLHNYVVTYPHATDAGFEQVVVPITPLIAASADFTDMWWVGLSENGWGLSIAQHGRIQFVVMYVYDGSGNPIWYVLPNGTWNATNTAYSGALYQPTSSPFSSYITSQFQPLGTTGASVGNATITYTGSGTATLTYTINGVSGSKSIVRQPFATDDGAAKLQVKDMWWAGPEENGWGMNIGQQGRVLFPVWYTYDSAGRTVFYTATEGVWNGSTWSGDIYSTVGSVWLGVNYNPAQFVVTKVGRMTLDFSDQSNAVMTYTIGNLTQKKVIMRQPYP